MSDLRSANRKHRRASWLWHVWSGVGIQTKLILVLVLLMSLSLVGNIIGFLLSARSTHASVFERQITLDQQRLVSALEHSENEAVEGASLLANALYTALARELSDSQINLAEEIARQSVVVRERFHLDQVIVLNSERQVRANAAPSGLESIHIRAPDLLLPCRVPTRHLATYEELNLLIVCTPIQSNSQQPTVSTVGHVYTILDMQSLLVRTRQALELVAVPQLAGTASTVETTTSNLSAASPEDIQQQRIAVALADGQVEVMLTVESRAINEIVNAGFRVMWISSALTLVLSVIITILVARRMLTGPLVRLTAVTEQVAEGDLNARARVESRDEIGRLATTFNATTAQLQELVQRLEQRVAQRTAELSNANEQLRQEIQERKRAEEQIQRQQYELERLAITDELTSLYNRRQFFVLSEHALSHARHTGHLISVIMLDMDHFKQINDTHGHACGDYVLQAMAERFKGGLRETDILGRYGGEEFVVLLPDTDVAAAYTIAERLRADVEQTPIQADELLLRVTISIGIASAAGGMLTLTELLARADYALYEAKRGGRNRVVVAEFEQPTVATL